MNRPTGGGPTPAKAPSYKQQHQLEMQIFDCFDSMIAALAYRVVMGVEFGFALVPTPTNVAGDLMPALTITFAPKTPEGMPESVQLTVPKDGPSMMHLVMRMHEAMKGMLNEAEREGAVDLTNWRQCVALKEKLRRNGMRTVLLPGEEGFSIAQTPPGG